MKIGLFYQSSTRYVAAFYAIEQFRKFYPDSPIAMYEDNSDVLKSVAEYFVCDYKKIPNVYENYEKRPFMTRGVSVDLNSTLIWFDRLYKSCITTLKDVDWVMHMEDDVWFLKKITGEPPHDLNSVIGRGWNDALYQYLGSNVRGSYGCGGAIFNRLKFIESYHKLKNVDWKLVDELAVDPKPTEWADIALTFAFLNNKSNVGGWEEIVNYRSYNQHHYSTRDAFVKETLNTKQGNASVIHAWKLYYYPTDDEITYVNTKLNEKNN